MLMAHSPSSIPGLLQWQADLLVVFVAFILLWFTVWCMERVRIRKQQTRVGRTKEVRPAWPSASRWNAMCRELLNQLPLGTTLTWRGGTIIIKEEVEHDE
jgi:hypothetical protein